MKPHELSPSTSRRAALGLVGGFVATAVGLAPGAHRRATLEADVDVDGHSMQFVQGDWGYELEQMDVDVAYHGAEPLDPLFFTSAHKRKSRHVWQIEDGPDRLSSGEISRFQLVAPSEGARLQAGQRAQLTLFQTGEEQWTTAHFRIPEQVISL